MGLGFGMKIDFPPWNEMDKKGSENGSQAD
jgi:hypothetical protein